MVSTAGVYSVTTTNACGTTTSNSITINILQTPIAPVISAMGATTFCQGNSLMLMGNTNGTWSNGSTASSIIVNQSGTYSVSSTNACGSSTSNAIVVTINPLPAASVISAIGATTFCSGGSVTLTGNSNGTWSDGSTNASITVSQSGPYYVTNVNSCGAVNSDTINITVLDSPVASVIAANGASTICSGDSITLNGNNGGVWSTGSTASSISVSQAGNYFVTTANNCGSVNSNSIAITVNTVDTAVLVGNASLLANATNASYQWLLCNGVFNPIAGETNQTFQPTMLTGFYAVAVTQNGCSDTSSCHVFMFTDIQPGNNPTDDVISVYPNPSNAMIIVHGNSRQHIIIQNALGEVVFSKSNCDASESIDVSRFAEGVYFVKSNLTETKFIKQ
jgi:hypothetical protein